MRRDEFNINDKNSIDEILKACEYGTLSLISEGKPYVVALNPDYAIGKFQSKQTYYKI